MPETDCTAPCGSTQPTSMASPPASCCVVTPPIIPAPMYHIQKGSSGVRDFRVYFTQPQRQLLDLNPKIVLMRYRQGRTTNPGGNRMVRSGLRWVHPVHRNGVDAPAGSNQNAGISYDNTGALIPPRDSEWPLIDMAAYSRTGITIDVASWFSGANTTAPTGAFHVPTGDVRWRPGGAGIDMFHKSQTFALAIQVDNQDPQTAVKTARIIGPMSTPFTADWSSSTDEVRIAVGERIPTARRAVP